MLIQEGLAVPYDGGTKTKDWCEGQHDQESKEERLAALLGQGHQTLAFTPGHDHGQNTLVGAFHEKLSFWDQVSTNAAAVSVTLEVALCPKGSVPVPRSVCSIGRSGGFSSFVPAWMPEDESACQETKW